MRPFEIAFLAANVPALALLSRSRGPWPVWIRLLPLVAAAFVVIQLVTEGYRWQMIPGYALTAGLLMIVIPALIRPAIAHTLVVWSGWILLAGAVTAGTVFPIVRIPKPDGRFPVATVVRHLVDPSRRETLSPQPGGPRELMVQIWYPAGAPVNGTKSRPVAAALPNYPILLYSPSWHGQRNQNTVLVEELASHGFVVVGIDHPYGSAVTVFPDGRVARAQPIEFWDLSSDASLQRSIEYNETQVQVRARDLISVLNELEKYNRADPAGLFTGRLDLSRAGALGFSFGGAVAAQACWLDRRFQAGMDMDGSLFGEVAEQGIPQPFLFMDEDIQPPAAAQLASGSPAKRRYENMNLRDFRLERHSLARYGGYRIGIRGTGHTNFEDEALFSPVRYFSEAGPIDPRRAADIVAAYTLAFFNKYLNHTRQPLLDSPSNAYPEVQFEAQATKEATR